MKTIGIIGAGNLGSHLSSLLYRNQLHEFVTISDVNKIRSEEISRQYGFNHASTYENISVSDIIFLTVKPNNIKEVCYDFNSFDNQRLLSVPQQEFLLKRSMSGQATNI